MILETLFFCEIMHLFVCLGWEMKKTHTNRVLVDFRPFDSAKINEKGGVEESLMVRG